MPHRRGVCHRRTDSGRTAVVALPEKCSDLDLWPLTLQLKTFSVVRTHMLSTCAKFQFTT